MRFRTIFCLLSLLLFRLNQLSYSFLWQQRYNANAFRTCRSAKRTHRIDLVGLNRPSVIKVDPYSQDFRLHDLNRKLTNFPGKAWSASDSDRCFPVTGRIDPNFRLILNLTCKIEDCDHLLSAIQNDSSDTEILVPFVIVSGSPYTYLSEDTFHRLIGNPAFQEIPYSLMVSINGRRKINCFYAPTDSDFSDLNILGMDYLLENCLSIVMDTPNSCFSLSRILK
jgi:hypothetical protein